MSTVRERYMSAAMDRYLAWFNTDQLVIQELQAKRLWWAYTCVSLVLQDDWEAAREAAGAAQAAHEEIQMLLEDTQPIDRVVEVCNE